MMKLKRRIQPAASLGYHILLALADGPQHGMAIAQYILGDSVGRAYPARSTLYEELSRLELAKLIERGGVIGRQHNYHLTNHGRTVLQEETKLLGLVLQIANRRLR